MDHELSPQTEQFLAQMVAAGVYPSKEAAIEAAVAVLREKNPSIPLVSDEHMDQVEQAIEEANAGLATPMTQDDWGQLRQMAHDASLGQQPSAD